MINFKNAVLRGLLTLALSSGTAVVSAAPCPVSVGFQGSTTSNCAQSTSVADSTIAAFFSGGWTKVGIFDSPIGFDSFLWATNATGTGWTLALTDRDTTDGVTPGPKSFDLMFAQRASEDTNGDPLQAPGSVGFLFTGVNLGLGTTFAGTYVSAFPADAATDLLLYARVANSPPPTVPEPTQSALVAISLMLGLLVLRRSVRD